MKPCDYCSGDTDGYGHEKNCWTLQLIPLMEGE